MTERMRNAPGLFGMRSVREIGCLIRPVNMLANAIVTNDALMTRDVVDTARSRES